jgi:hypothetical protein
MHFSEISVTQAKAAVVIEGLPENPIENLSLSSLHADGVDDGLSVSHVRKLLLEGTTINAARGPALQVTDVRECEVNRCGTKTPDAQHADIQLERAENIVIQSCSTSEFSRALIELKGVGSRRVTLTLNRVPKTVQEIVLTDGASEAAIDSRM